MKIKTKLQKSVHIHGVISLFSVLLILVFWHLASVYARNAVLVPSPLSVLSDFVNLLTLKMFWLSLLFSLSRALVGFALSLFLGLLIGVAAGRNARINAFFLPYLVIMRSTPVISFILLALIWFSSGNVAIVVAFLVMFPLLCSTINQGVRSIDKRLIEMSQVYNFSRQQRFFHIYLPGIAPFLLTGAANALGMGWRAVIIGEVLSQPIRGLGTNLHQAHTYLKVSELIAWTIAAILVGYLFELVLRLGENYFTPWKLACNE